MTRFCVRLPSVAGAHAATGFLIFLIGRKLYSDLAGLIAALAYATLPGVSLSAGIISTDVPLLFAWALALYAFTHLVDRPTLAMAALLGFALGLGLQCQIRHGLFCAVCGPLFHRCTGAPSSLLEAAAPVDRCALAVANPHRAESRHGTRRTSFATFSHTADNAKWSGSLGHPGKAAEFLLSQFGVMGPILFGALLVIVWRARRSFSDLTRRRPLPAARILRAGHRHHHCAGVPFACACQSWAASAYVAGVVLVTCGDVARPRVDLAQVVARHSTRPLPP